MDLTATFADQRPSIRGGGSPRGSLRGPAPAPARPAPPEPSGPPDPPEQPPEGPPPAGPAPADRGPRRGASPGTAALLSLVFPGLGQLMAGAIRRGLFVAVPTAVLIIVVGAALGGGMKSILAALVQPGILYAVIVLNAAYAIYHLFAIGDAFWVARRLRGRPASRRATGVLAIALVAAVGLHGLVGAVGVEAYQTVSAVFVPPGSGYVVPPASFAPGSSALPGATPSPTPTPGPAWAADGRLNLLLIGADSGPGRTLLRTDTMILLSVDVDTGQAALFGIPRNLLNAPLATEDAKAFPNGRFPGLLNALFVYAYEHPGAFPDGGCTPPDSDACGAARGFRAISGAIQQLVGVPLDGAVVVNLNGFVDLVDAIGGLWIRTVHVYDTRYPLENGQGYVTIDIAAGCHHLDGHLALAYARSRHQDSDYGRMQRQQQVLVALLREVDPIALLPKVPKLLDIAKTNLTLAIPEADIGSLAALASSVDPSTVQRIEFSPPDYQEFLTDREIGRIQKTVRTVFDAPNVLGGNPTPNPSSKPTPNPSPTDRSCGPG